MARSTKRCDSLPHSITIACFSWLTVVNNIAVVDRPSVEGPPKQHNRPDLSPGCLGATCQVRSTITQLVIVVVAGLSVMLAQSIVTTHMTCGCISLVIALLQIYFLISTVTFFNWLIFDEVSGV